MRGACFWAGALKWEVFGLIILTKLNKEPVTINDRQIEFIEQIPESKVTMMNGRYHIVRESPQEIIDKVLCFNQEIMSGIKVEV